MRSFRRDTRRLTVAGSGEATRLKDSPPPSPESWPRKGGKERGREGGGRREEEEREAERGRKEGGYKQHECCTLFRVLILVEKL